MEQVQGFEKINLDGREFPVVAAFVGGQPAPVVGDTDCAVCDHRGATWSSDLGLCCPRCGAPMFLPPRFLAQKSVDDIEAMYGLWRAAGCPPWYSCYPGYPDGLWGIVPSYWELTNVTGFERLGGLPVDLARRENFALARREFEL